MALSKKQKEAFASLQAAINASPEGFVYAPAASVSGFVLAGLVEVNETMKDEAGNVAVRLKTQTTTEGTNVTQAQTNAAPAGNSAFAIEDGVPMPAASARGRGGNTYPFDQLQPGQSFFVANTEAKPNAAKSLASTVSSATARYAEIIPGQMKKDKKGNDVPATKETRKFVVRAVEGGARVWRTA